MSTMTLNKVLTVSEITFQIKSNLEKFFPVLAVQGEISNLKRQASGHIYFSLKDSSSQISAVMFRGNASKLTRIPKAGDQVTVRGQLNVYAPRGNYQIVVREMELLGVGELLLKLHKLKEELKMRGWFSPEKKKKLPHLPKRIGMVTSPTGAVIQDVLHVLKRRFSSFHLILNPVKVQGEGAAEEISQAIEQMNQYDLADVLIVGRGGGSIEDLWAFNEEIVARAIFESRIPVISAVGHETDTSIADLVADVRAPTPSAAAEIVIKEREQLLKFLDTASKRIESNLKTKVHQNREKVHLLVRQNVFSSSDALLGRYMQQIDEFKSTLSLQIKHMLEVQKNQIISFREQLNALQPSTQIANYQQKLRLYQTRLDEGMRSHFNIQKEKFDSQSLRKEVIIKMKSILDRKKEKLTSLVFHLRSLDPKNLLKKGYSILFSEKDSSIILSTKDIEKNQKIRAKVYDGSFTATIEEIN